MKPPPIAFFLFANVGTLVGFPPTPCALLLFLATAERLCDSVIRAAFAAGTHLGYFLFDPLADFLPHSFCLLYTSPSPRD